VRTSVRNGLIAAAGAVVVAAGVVPLAAGGSGPVPPAATNARYVGPATTSQDRAAIAAAILADLRAGDFAGVRRGFDANMSAQLSTDQLAAGWQQFEAQFGSYRSHGSPSEARDGAFWVVRVPVDMARLPGELRVAFDGQGRIAGLFLLRQGVPLDQAGAPTVQASSITARAAQDALTELARGDFAAVQAGFDPTMNAAVSQDQLRSVWDQLTTDLGSYRSSGAPVVVSMATAVLYDFPLDMAKGAAHLQVAVGPDGRIAGLYLRPGPPTGVFGR